MADTEILSQSKIDELIQQANAALKNAKDGESKDDIVKKALQKSESCHYICAYCKHIINVEYERVKIAPMLFISGYKSRGKPCKNVCGHWYVSADYLKSLKSKVVA